MSLLTTLGLAPPKAMMQGAAAPADADRGRRRAPAAAKATSAKTATPGSAASFVSVGLGTAPLGGSRKGRLLSIVGPDGYPILSGGGGWHGLLAANRAGAESIRELTELKPAEGAWRNALTVLERETARAAAALPNLDKARHALRGRAGSKGDTFDQVDAYLDKLAAVRQARGKIDAAEERIREAEAKLAASNFDLHLDEAETKAAAAKHELDALKAEIEETKGIVTSIYNTIKSFDMTKLADLAMKAVAYVEQKVIDSAVEAYYAPRLNDLAQKVADLEAKAKGYKSAKLKSRIEEATHGLAAACKEAALAVTTLRDVIEDMSRHEFKATKVLEQSGATQILGKLVDARGAQLKRIVEFQTPTEDLLSDVAAAEDVLRKAIAAYDGARQALDDLARTGDARLVRTGPWAKAVDFVALKNLVEVGKWMDWLGSVRSDVRKARRWIADPRKGATAPFENAVDEINKAISSGHAATGQP